MLCGRLFGQKGAGGKTTVGFNTTEKEVEGVKLQFWDTAGKMKFRNPEITRCIYHGSDVVVIVVNISSERHVIEEQVQSWFSEIRRFTSAAAVFVALNFCNIPERQECTDLVANISSKYQSDEISFVPVCSSDGTGVNCLLRDLRKVGVQQSIKTAAERQRQLPARSTPDDSHLRRMHSNGRQRFSLANSSSTSNSGTSPKTDKLDNVVKSLRDTFRNFGKKLPFSFN
eukprot:TRINITY_DN8360_c0_g1_i1.p1 TRINITY_DN8360_c0_g1~~TRINITY_DN8360_c0_g1_i1.p1  ORF type:complete len:267 (+),score=39.76 TRINITY_DN8360_c0_g1_i1:120-803(+)